MSGTTPAVLLTGVHWYLKYVCGAHIAWNGSQLDLPKTLPAPPRPLERSTTLPHRFALNDTNDGYTAPYADWPYWERMIDVLALHGCNEVLVIAGTEAVYERVLKDFGYSDAESRAWLLYAHAPAVVAPAEPVGVRRTALARTRREARGAGPEDHRQAARARYVARVPRLLRACPPRLRGTQRRRRARGAAGHLARLRPARLARPAHPVLRRRGRLVLPASAGPVRRGRALQDGPAARGRHRR